MRVAVRRGLATAVTAGALMAACASCGEPAAPDATQASGSPAPGTASAGPSAPAGAGSASPDRSAPASTPSAQVRRVEVTVRDGRPHTASGRVKVRRGATVEIAVTSDTAEEFHLHGYDRTLTLRPGGTSTLRLVADTPGVFEAELHHSGARVFELQVG